MGVGAQVHAAGVAAFQLRGVQPRHPAGAGQGDPARSHAQTCAASLVQQPQRRQRPQQVILFFHRQRPQVLEQAGLLDRLEIRLLRDDLPPVGQVQKGSGQVFAQARQGSGLKQRRERHQQQQHDQGRREQTPCTAQVKSREIDAPRLGVLLQQQRRDDETGDGEKDVHPQKTCGQKMPQVQVVADHGQHGHAAQAVQSRQTRQCAHGLTRPKSTTKVLASSR